MYEYNFNEMRTNIEQILDISLAENKDRYYNQLEVFKNNKNMQGSSINNDIKKKKIITKDSIGQKGQIEKEIVDFEDIENLKFETFYNIGIGLFEMTSQTIFKTFSNIKFEFVIFKNCIFKNVKFENCTFSGCEFLECEFLNTKFKTTEFFDFTKKNITYFFECSFENTIFEKSNLRKSIFQKNTIKTIQFILSNLKKCIFDSNKIESIYFSDCNLKSFSIIKSDISKLEFDDEFITKLNENTFFDKFISKDKNKSYYKNVYKSYKNIASQFESNRILNISGEYHYLYKCSECKTLDGFSKFKSRLFWIVCGYGERPTYALITSLEIILIFAIIYLFTGISIGGRIINYRLSWFSILEKKIILVDFLESLYFSLVTFTTVGYGDIIPTGTSIILSSIEMILGVTMVGIWTATLARKITR